MKTAYFICILLLFTQNAFAQNPDSTVKTQPQVFSYNSKKTASQSKWFATIPSFSIGKYPFMPGIGFAYLHKSGWGASFEIKGGQINSPNVPKDFNSGTNLFLFFSGLWLLGNDGIPNEKTDMLLFSVLREMPGKNGDFVTTLQGGFSYVGKRYPHNFVFVPVSDRWLTGFDNYTYQTHISKTMGLYVKPGCKFLFNKHVALSTSAWAILQPNSAYYGLEVGLQFGKLR